MHLQFTIDKRRHVSKQTSAMKIFQGPVSLCVHANTYNQTFYKKQSKISDTRKEIVRSCMHSLLKNPCTDTNKYLKINYTIL